MTNLIVAAFTLCYFAVTLFLCRGMRLSARDICLAGLMSAATLVLRCFLITLPNGSHISLGAMLPILLLSLLVNARVAFCAGWVTGLLAMLLLPDWQPVHWAQPFVEQLICFFGLCQCLWNRPALENYPGHHTGGCPQRDQSYYGRCGFLCPVRLGRLRPLGIQHRG